MTNATSFQLSLPNEAATARFAAALATLCLPGDCITLSGPLGAGKTTFARSFIQALCGPVEVSSPTFVLVNTYQTSAGTPLLHADLYRLKAAQELPELGLEEAFTDGIVLVEWPEVAAGFLSQSRLSLGLELPEDAPEARILVGKALSSWYIRLKEGALIS